MKGGGSLAGRKKGVKKKNAGKKRGEKVGGKEEIRKEGALYICCAFCKPVRPLPEFHLLSPQR